MENNIHIQTDITANCMHEIAIGCDTTIREVCGLVGDRIFEIVGDCVKNFDK